MDYVVRFGKSNSVRGSNFKVAASCASEAWEQAEERVPSGYMVIDVAPQVPKSLDRGVRQVG